MQQEEQGNHVSVDHIPVEELETSRINIIALHQQKSVGFVKLNSIDFFETFNYQAIKHDAKAKKLGKEMLKYYVKRQFYFSKYDQGIMLDKQSWYSVVAEPITMHIAQRLNDTDFKRVFQPFCGVGGVAVHLSRMFTDYIVNDLDINKINMLKNNLQVYGVPVDHLKYYNEDFLKIQPFPCDLVILCPPWGGIDLRRYSSQPLDDIMFPKLSNIFKHAIKFSKNMILQMPKNTNIQNILLLVRQYYGTAVISIDKINLNNKCSQLHIFAGVSTLTKINNGNLWEVIYDAFDATTKEQKSNVKAQFKNNQDGVFDKIFQKYFI